MKYELPNLDNEYFKMYKDKFLSINNLNIGDTVTIKFNYNIIRSNHKRKQERYNEYKECEGILKEDSNGHLYAESIDRLEFFNLTDNGLTGRSRREWYKRELRHSVYKFGSGYKH